MAPRSLDDHLYALSDQSYHPINAVATAVGDDDPIISEPQELSAYSGGDRPRDASTRWTQTASDSVNGLLNLGKCAGERCHQPNRDLNHFWSELMFFGRGG